MVTTVAVHRVPSLADCHRYSPTCKGDGMRTGEYHPVRAMASQIRIRTRKKADEMTARFIRRPPFLA